MLALGYNTWLGKLIAFVVAGMFVGLAGVLIAYYVGFYGAGGFQVVNSTPAVMMVIIGGAGTISALVGAAFITVVEQFATPSR